MGELLLQSVPFHMLVVTLAVCFASAAAAGLLAGVPRLRKRAKAGIEVSDVAFAGSYAVAMLFPVVVMLAFPASVPFAAVTAALLSILGVFQSVASHITAAVYDHTVNRPPTAGAAAAGAATRTALAHGACGLALAVLVLTIGHVPPVPVASRSA
jgi:hypothetical protein